MALWSCYFILRLVIGIVDFVTDIIFSINLLYAGHHCCGCLALTFPFLAMLFSCICVTADWIRGTKNINKKNFIVVTLTRLTELNEPFFESAPELVLQMTMIWRYVFHDPIHI